MAQNSEAAKAKMDTEVLIDGKKYKFQGTVDFSNLTIKKIGDDVPDPDPLPTDPTKPTEGTVKEGGWGADLVNKAAWKVVNMKKPAEQFKIVDGAGKNVATNFTKKETAENFVTYFQTHEFPPKDDTGPTDPPVDPPVDPNPQPGGSGVTKDGVKIPYETTGKMEYVFKNNDRDDGKRMDFNSLKAGEYVNAVVLGYFAFPQDNAPDDEVSGKFSAMPHSGSNKTECFDMGTGIKDGATRIRYESKHPEYTGDLGKGEKGLPLKTKYIGYMYARKNLPNGNVLCEQWQDQGDNEGSTPANKWVKLFSWEDPKYQFKDYKDGHTITIRVDGSNVVKDMKLKWLCMAEIK
jgi:hypothetical protein